MGIFRIPIIADNTISTVKEMGNAGASQIVDVWGHYDLDRNKKYLARILAKADITALTEAISTGKAKDPSDASVSCNLKFFNINHADPQAYEFTVQCFPVTRPWNEGKGTRIDTFTITGYSSWASASPTAAWTATGGDYKVDSNSASQYFTSGYEDLSLNIRSLVSLWQLGTSANNGFLLKMDDTAELLTGSSTTDPQYYRKTFHGRLTNFPSYAPYIQLEWDDSIEDSRSIFQFGTSGKLYFFNVVGGVFRDIDSITTWFPGTVAISGATSNVASAYQPIFSALTAERVKTGVYSVSFTLPSSSTTYSYFKDVWSITSAASASMSSVSQTFTPVEPVSAQPHYANYDTTLKIINSQSEITKGNSTIKRLFIRENTADVTPLAQSELNSISSVASTSIANTVSTNGFYRILNSQGRVDLDWQKLSFDNSGNFFVFDSDNFARNVLYNFQFKINLRGQTFVFENDPSYRFIIR